MRSASERRPSSSCLKSEIGWRRRCQLKGDRLVEIEGRARKISAQQFSHFKMHRHALFAQRPARGQVIVAEEVHLRLEKAAGVVQVFDLEALQSLAQDVQASIGIPVEHADDLGGAADHGQALALRLYHAKRALARQALADHLPITVFEDVERQRCSRKEHDLKGKQGYLHAIVIRQSDGC